MKKWIAGLLCLLMVVLFCACDKQGKITTGDSQNDGNFEIIDMCDRTVTIPTDAKSFACIGPGCLRLYCYVADESKLAGIEEVEKSWGEGGRTYRMAMENVEEYAIIGPGGPGNAPDAEMLFAAKPDVIFSCYAMEKAEIDELQKKINIPIVILSYGEASLFAEEINESLRIIGKVTGNTKRAESLITYLTDAKEDLMSRTAGVKTPVRAYLGCQSNRGAHGIESTTGDYPMFDVLHAENVVATAGINQYIMLDKEKLVEMNPEVIIIDAGGLSILQEDYKANPKFYNSLSAVKNGKVYLQMPFNYYHTNIDIALADAYYIGKVLYPELFADIDPAEKFDEITMEMLGIKAYDKIAESYYGGFQSVKLGK
ncbi:MAG: iron ABC transporter substrate-binding protein [Ruminococcaceae bacterium]|nr:iron ABC transporter substrate-binding protein [Oscillospiraceae bacterium]